MNYVAETRHFVDKLVHIQQHIRDKKLYRRVDQRYIDYVLYEIERYLQLYNTDNEKVMRRFWDLHSRRVKQLLPSKKYSGFSSLLAKFEELDNYYKNEIWNSVTNNLVN